MIPYLVLLLVVVSIVRFGRRYGSYGIQRLALTTSGLMLVLFAGLRDRLVGTDTGNYVTWLDRITSLESAWVFPVEKGFTFLVYFSSLFSESYFVLLGLIAAICVTCYLFAIAQLVSRYETAIFLFVTLGSYTFFFNGARQGIAAAICFLALPFLLQRKAITYLFFVVLATLFHKTAIVALPLYFLASDRISWRRVATVLLCGLLMAASISIFAQLAASFLDEKYASYGQTTEGGGEVKAIFLVGQAALFLLFRHQVGESHPYYSRLLNIYLIGLIPAIASVIASVNPSGILRLTIYFEHTAILLWPLFFASFVTNKNKAIASAGFLLLTLVFFILTTTSFSNLVPYRLNAELFG